jgi:hypothetical protein
MSFLCGGLVGASPERPCNDIGGIDASLGEALGYPADFLDRPADEGRGFVVGYCLIFLGIVLFA